MEAKLKEEAIGLFRANRGHEPQEEGLNYIGIFNPWKLRFSYVYAPSEKEYQAYVEVQTKLRKVVKFMCAYSLVFLFLAVLNLVLMVYFDQYIFEILYTFLAVILITALAGLIWVLHIFRKLKPKELSYKGKICLIRSTNNG